MGGSGLMCANESAIVDGNHDPKAGYWHGVAAVLLLGAGRGVGRWRDCVRPGRRRRLLRTGRSHRCRRAQSAVVLGRRVSERDLRRSCARSGGFNRPRGYSRAVKNASRQDAFSIGNASHRIHVRRHAVLRHELLRRRTHIRMDSADLRITRSRFLYAPVTGIRLGTTRRLSRAARPTSTSKTTRPSSARLPSSTRAPVLGSSATTSPSTASRRGARATPTTRPSGRSSPTTRCCTTATRPGISAGRGPPLPPQPRHRLCGNQNSYGAFVLNRRVVLDAIDAPPARWRGDAGSSPLTRARTAASSPRNYLVKNCRCTRRLVDFHACHRVLPGATI